MSRPSRSTPSGLTRPIETLGDAGRELFAQALRVNRRVKLLGLFNAADMPERSPEPGDLWIEYDAASGAYTMRLQLAADRVRLRASWTVSLVNA